MKLRPALSTLRQCQLILRAASWIVPSDLRRQWLQEWEAEVSIIGTGFRKRGH